MIGRAQRRWYDQGWFVGLHVFNTYVRLAFFRGADLDPPPPVASKAGVTRYFHIHEDDALDGRRLANWIDQATGCPASACSTPPIPLSGQRR
ncbi:MAG: hypothetical protein Q8S47_11325 [Phenylobacterium sp.]|nr:hypothetical protein [Phenylobacterium sp.]